MTLKDIVEGNDTLPGRLFDLCIQFLILLSIAAFSVETLPNLSPGTHFALRAIEIFTVAVFTVEYVLRIAVADDKRRFVTSFYGIVDLAAVLPFYIAAGLDLRAVRVLRLLRLLRALKLLRYSRAVHRFHQAFLISKEEIVAFFFVSWLLIFVAAVGIYHFERPVQPDSFGSIFASLWWAVATLTTVGYGDVYPVTPGGKVFTFFVLMLGLGIVAVPAGLVASALSEARKGGSVTAGSPPTGHVSVRSQPSRRAKLLRWPISKRKPSPASPRRIRHGTNRDRWNRRMSPPPAHPQRRALSMPSDTPTEDTP